jgi:4-amino-4-deoxy-L-arabinose transferase-like glycosyltransferase
MIFLKNFLHHLCFWRHKAPERSWLDEFAISLILLLLLLISAKIRSSVETRIEYQLQDTQSIEGDLPLFFPSQSPPLSLTVTVYISTHGLLQPSLYRIRADDCLTSMTINGQPVAPSLLRPCVIDTPTDIALRRYMTLPENVVVATIQDTGGRQGLSIAPSPLDPLLLNLHISLIVAFLILCILLSMRAKNRMRPLIFLVLCIGVLLRLGYLAVTPFDVRSNDSEGHLEYIQYVADHWTIPPLHGGWEFYQPPLYYAVAAVPYAGLRSLGVSDVFNIRVLQFLSVLMSFAVLALCMWIAEMLFTTKQQVERVLWTGMFAVFPGLILLSPRINNDSLVHLLCFGAIALMIAFWQNASVRLWYALVLVLSLAVLTKLSAAPLFMAAACVLLFHPSIPWRKKCTLSFFGLCLALACTEWLFIWRLVEDPEAGIVGNIDNLHDGLRLTQTWKHYVTFNPLAILEFPYNDTWGDSARRQYFLEFLFRSAYFGEFRSGVLLRAFTQVTLFTGLLSCILSFYGAIQLRADTLRKALPLWHIFFWALVGHIVFVIIYPFASSQDFRYSIHLILPLLYFAIYPISTLTTFWRRICITVLGCSIVLNTAYIGSLILTEYTG